MSNTRTVAVKFEKLSSSLSKYNSDSLTEQQKLNFSTLAANFSLLAHFLIRGESQDSYQTIVTAINNDMKFLESPEKKHETETILSNLKNALAELKALPLENSQSLADIEALIAKNNNDARQFSQAHPLASSISLGFITQDSPKEGSQTHSNSSSCAITEKLLTAQDDQPKSPKVK